MTDPAIRVRVAVCVCRDDEILLVEHEKRGARYWLLPGGGLERGETLTGSARRECLEETGYDVEVGRLIVVCEAIDPAGGRHIVNFAFAGSLLGGALTVGHDRSLRDARWRKREDLPTLTMFPPINDVLAECWNEDFTGPVRVLGNVWKELPTS